MALVNYDFDLEKLIKQLLGAIHRQPVRVAWLKALSKGLRIIHDAFLSFTDSVVDSIKWNGQTIKLERILQLTFGDGIYITTNSQYLDQMSWGAGNDFAGTLGAGDDVASFFDDNFDVAGFNFTVNVPSSITFDETEMRGLINKYKLLGTTYNIVIV